MTDRGGVTDIKVDSAGRAASQWLDGFWQSEDGLKLHYRDYPCPSGSNAVPALCIPGLTRNARDFHDLAVHLSQERRVIAVDLRGRGESEYAKDPATYNPLQYAHDLQPLFSVAGIQRAVFIGSSLGGLVTMICALVSRERIAGVVLNDVGPVIQAEGLKRIAAYVGHGRSFPTWMHAARALQEVQGDNHPDWAVADWLADAKRGMVLGGNGRISFDYDMRIGDGLADGVDEAAKMNLWPGFEALAGGPVLVVRGDTSDILSGTVAREMVGTIPGVEMVTVPRTGHLPTLSEPHVREAIDRLFRERLSSAAAQG